MLHIDILIRFFGEFYGIFHIHYRTSGVEFHCWKLIKYQYIFYLMELLVAYQNDPAGHNMAKFISQELEKDGIGLKRNLIMMDTCFCQNTLQNLVFWH